MLRVSTTTLEQFRRVIVTDYAHESELIQAIMGEPVAPSWKMSVGADFHGLMEEWPLLVATGRIDLEAPPETPVAFGQCLFRLAAMKAVMEHVGSGVPEVKGTKEVIRGVTVVAKADMGLGLALQDHKLTFAGADLDQYAPSLQWRMSLFVHEAAVFRYNVFEVSEPRGSMVELKRIYWTKFWPYVGLERDCKNWLERFLDWAESKHLLGYLTRSGTSPAVPCG